MTRTEHLQWCKDRAMALVERGELVDAVASMMSDIGKHDETAKAIPATAVLGLLAAQQAQHGDRDGVVRFIKGFN
jgi:hypothetical protein